MEYFITLFRAIVKYATAYQDLRQKLLKMLYYLLVLDSEIIDRCTNEKEEQQRRQTNNLPTETISRSNTEFFGGVGNNRNNFTEEDIEIAEDEHEMFRGYMESVDDR